MGVGSSRLSRNRRYGYSGRPVYNYRYKKPVKRSSASLLGGLALGSLIALPFISNSSRSRFRSTHRFPHYNNPTPYYQRPTIVRPVQQPQPQQPVIIQQPQQQSPVIIQSPPLEQNITIEREAPRQVEAERVVPREDRMSEEQLLERFEDYVHLKLLESNISGDVSMAFADLDTIIAEQLQQVLTNVGKMASTTTESIEKANYWTTYNEGTREFIILSDDEPSQEELGQAIPDAENFVVRRHDGNASDDNLVSYIKSNDIPPENIIMFV